MRKDRARTARRGPARPARGGERSRGLEPASPRVAADGARSRRGRLVPGQGTTVADGSLMRFREGNRKVEVKWRSMVGREGDGHAPARASRPPSPSSRDGRASTATITADECLYQPQPQRGVVPGQRAGAHRRRPRARHGAAQVLGGRGAWPGPTGRRPLPAGHDARAAPAGSSTGRRAGPRADGRREAAPGGRGGAADGDRGGDGEGVAGRAPCRRSTAGSLVRQGARELRSERLQLYLRRRDLTRSSGRRRSRTWTCGSARARRCPAWPSAEGGEKRLRCRRLKVFFRARGILLGGDRGQPGQPGGPARPARRARSAAGWRPTVIRFGFDEQGRLTLPRGPAGGGPTGRAGPSSPRSRSGADPRRPGGWRADASSRRSTRSRAPCARPRSTRTVAFTRAGAEGLGRAGGLRRGRPAS